MIDKRSEEQLKNSIDIVDIISNYIELKKAGANYKANCPFHHENTPSFIVSPSKQIFRCFGCLAPTEEIRTNKGLKEIQHIEIGDVVYASNGMETEVIKTLKHKPQYEILKFKTDLINDWSFFTENHDMLIVSKEEAFKKLPYIRVEKNRTQKFYKVIKKRKHIKPIVLNSTTIFAKEVKRGDYFLYPINREIDNRDSLDISSFWEKNRLGKNVKKIETVKITTDLMWLFGIYIAEGSTYRGGIKFSLHSKERAYADKIIKVLKDSFNKKASLFYPKNRKNSLKVTCSSTNLEFIFKKLFSRGAINKNYPYFFNYLKRPLREALLKGLMDGDGCYSNGTYATISRNLAYSVVDLAISLEMIPALYQRKAYKDKKGVHYKKYYEILFRKRESLKSFFEEINGIKYLLIRVKEIEKGNREEFVYDITVRDKSHSFLTKSFLVGNCGTAGDAIKFVQEYEKLNYPEALEKIASIMNFSLVHTKKRDNFSEIRRVLEQIQKWYRKNLNLNQRAKEYLLSRGVNTQSIEEFGIGYIGKSNDLIEFLSNNFLPFDKAEEAGVIANGDKEYYARLTNRITFPIYSPSDEIVGFGGRTIVNHPAKYINSPQTKLFNKSQLLYGYSKAKTYIYREKKIIICEGYLDVILFHQVGFHTAVATLGTALTEEHLPILKKAKPDIILAYDGDKAGINAGLKASKILSIHGFNGSVVLFPEGKDPADMIADGRVDEVASLLKDGKELIPFTIEMIAKSYNLNNSIEKESAFREIREFLDRLSPFRREENISYSATILGISPKLFSSQTKVENSKIVIERNRDNLSLLNIIKTLLEDDSRLEKVLTLLEPIDFGEYAFFFELISNGDKNHPDIVNLMSNNIYKSLNDTQFNRALINFITFLYRQKIKNIIKDTTVSYNKKQYIIRKIKTDILPRLQNGELVPFNIV